MLLRHDWTTLYANGIRYLEKAPLLYWSMAASMKAFGVGDCASARSRSPSPSSRWPSRSKPSPAEPSTAREPDSTPPSSCSQASASSSSPASPSPTRWSASGSRSPSSATGSPNSRTSHRVRRTKPRMPHPDRSAAEWRDLLLYHEIPTAPAACSATASPPAAPSESSPKASSASSSPSGSSRSTSSQPAAGAAPSPASSTATRSPATAVFLLIAAPWHILIGLANPTQGNPGSITFTQRTLDRPAAHRRQRPRLDLVLLRQRAPAPLPQPPRPARLRHRPALALLGTHPHLADALERLPLPRHRRRSVANQLCAEHHSTTRAIHAPAPGNLGRASTALLLPLHPAGVLRPSRAARTHPADRRLAHARGR